MLVRMKLPALLDPELEGKKRTAICKVYSPQDKLLATHTFWVDLTAGNPQTFNFNMEKKACGLAIYQTTWMEGCTELFEAPLDYSVDLKEGVEPHMDLTIAFDT